MTITSKPKIVIDLDQTLTKKCVNGDYAHVEPNTEVIETLKRYHKEGFEIIIVTARNMRTFDGNVGQIIANTVPTIIEWLKKHDIPYDEVHVGKPWCGENGFYVDDKAIRPDEFVNMSYSDIMKLV